MREIILDAGGEENLAAIRGNIIEETLLFERGSGVALKADIDLALRTDHVAFVVQSNQPQRGCFAVAAAGKFVKLF